MALALARIYQQSFDSHPHLTLAAVNGGLSAIGDAVAQLAQITLRPPEQRAKDDHTQTSLMSKYDPQRTARFFVFGLGMGPIIGRWNKFLEFQFPLKKSPQQTNIDMGALAKRVLCDQLCMAPIGIAAFLGCIGIMEGLKPAQVRQKFSDLYTPALFANWKVWPLAQLINFRYLPLPYRVPFSQTCGVFWTLYLSLLNSRQVKTDHIDDARSKNRI